ncbi:MAG: hypothetical protein ABIF77_11675 [bacterium]
MKASNLVDLDEINKTVDLAVSAGIFYDRNNSLLASLLWAHTKDYRLRLNIYPGLIELGPVSPSLFVSLNRDDQIYAGFGLDLVEIVPLGLAWSFSDP